MTGTFINVITVLIGGTLGMLFGNRLPDRVSQTIIAGLGLFTGALGVSMFLDTQNPILVLGSLLIGGLLGEWWRIEYRLERLGGWLQSRVGKLAGGEAGEADRRERFISGFLTASLLFCIGPMAILGSIQDGLVGDYELLAIKSVLDGFASIALAASLGIGVLFSVVIVLAYQGGISLLAAQLTALFPADLLENAMIPELTATGGVILIAIAISSLLGIMKIRAGNFLPALVIAPLLVWVLDLI